jgi:hypothetical protein
MRICFTGPTETHPNPKSITYTLSTRDFEKLRYSILFNAHTTNPMMPYRLKDPSYFPRYFQGVRPEFQSLLDTMEQDDYDEYMSAMRRYVSGNALSAEDTIVKIRGKLSDKCPAMKAQDWANKEGDLVIDWSLALFRSRRSK